MLLSKGCKCNRRIPLDQSRMIEQAKFTYSAFREDFTIQIKTVQDQWGKQALKVLKPDKQL